MNNPSLCEMVDFQSHYGVNCHDLANRLKAMVLRPTNVRIYVSPEWAHLCVSKECVNVDQRT